MSLLAIKMVAAVVILVVGVIGGVIPLLAAHRRGSHRFFSLGNSLAGGMFLGAGFIHLLPDAVEVFGRVTEYPVAPLLAAVGVGILLLLDRVLLESPKGSDSDKAWQQPIYPLVLLVVLSIHSLIAGAALGLQSDLATSMLVILGFLFHKGSAAFALVVCVFASGAGMRRSWTSLAILVTMAPLGIVIGTLTSSLLEGQAPLLLEGVFSALAAGTFIYIAILDVINSELSTVDDRVAHFIHSALGGEDDVPMLGTDTDRAIKFVLVLLGLGIMAVLWIWI